MKTWSWGRSEQLSSTSYSTLHVLILNFHSCLFAYNKNYQEIALAKGLNVFSDKNSLDGSDSAVHYKTFTFDFMFKKFLDFGEDMAVSRIKIMANWRLKTTENMLMALLKNGMDAVAR